MRQSEKADPPHIVKTVWWAVTTGTSVSKGLYIGMIICRILQSCLPILETYLFSLIITDLVHELAAQKPALTEPLLILFIATCITTLCIKLNAIAVNYTEQVFQYRFDKEMWAAYIRKMLELDMTYHEDADFKTRDEKVKEAISLRADMVMKNIVFLIANLISLLAIVGLFWSVNPFFMLLILIPVLLNFFINKKYGLELYDIWGSKGNERKHARHAISALDDKDIIQEAKIYGFGSYIVKLYEGVTNDFIASALQTLRVKYIFQSGVSIFSTIISLGINISFISDVLAKKIPLQSYIFYISNASRIQDNLFNLESKLSAIFADIQYVTDLKEFLASKPVIFSNKNQFKVNAGAPTIEFRNVSFRYPHQNEYILRDVSFTIHAGEKVALVGENGAGKSTIIKLIARFYDVSEGTILINGVDIRKLDLSSYYSLWGVLFQRFARYWFSLQENIGLGSIGDMDNLDRIYQAAQKADLEKVIGKLPFGFSNMLSNDFEGGKDLSGGEWQKVAIARGMFADPQLIILDEPTSALDALSEARMFEEIYKLSEGTTVIMVSHRFATVRKANKILVLENGHIAEEGSHETLTHAKGLYHEMFSTQAAGYQY